ncbi:unnamed protein product [Ceutorhynchus assimilis]|uniref:Inositol-1-monophosphatase n=1 Tax=Ceutorhynchus assimilis TaxID=467358 RepID=A0A9N9Q9U5_9CUCU|nr:unnamed protein product [Ceutorhynchus assimilis]
MCIEMAELSEIKTYYEFILPKVLEAGKILLEAKNIKFKLKNNVDWDWVTEYDKKVESVLNKQIMEKYPGHCFIGEESQEDKIQLTDAPTWIIDPIDGTENFTRNLRLSCISVGMTINKIQVFGIAYNPFMDEMFTAIKGQGAYLNGERIFVTQQDDYTQSFFNYEIGMARVGEYFYNLYMFRLKHLIAKVMNIRSLGSSVLGLCYVACGRTDAYQCDGLHVWDAAAGTLIVREAGGYVIDPTGKEFDLLKPNFLATSTKALAEQLVAIEKEADKEMEKVTGNNGEFVP